MAGITELTGGKFGLNKVIIAKLKCFDRWFCNIIAFGGVDLRMNDFSTETAVCLRTLRYSVLIGVANAFYAPMIHIINCSQVFKKINRSSGVDLHIFRSDMSSCTAETFLFWGICIVVIGLRAENTYLVIQTWRMVKWFQYPCPDVCCYPWFEICCWQDFIEKIIARQKPQYI